MEYREVTIFEIKGILRLWLDGWGMKPIARHFLLDPKTVRCYLRAAEAEELQQGAGLDAVTDDLFAPSR